MKYTRTLAVIAALAVLEGLAQPPVDDILYDVSRDFSSVANPNGPWSYGWKSDAAGAFALLSVHEVYTVENGVPVQLWWYGPRHNPMIGYNATTSTAIHDSGQAVLPPGTVWFEPGLDGQPQNFGVIRFTVPNEEGGTYRLESAVQCYLDGDRSGDTDYHVVVNGSEVFGQSLPPRTATGYTNVLTLSPGSTIDFMVGRGADGHSYGSGLKIQATLRQPAFCSPHRALATANVINGFVIGATVVDGGCGYTNVNPPAVWILGGGGSGATAEAVVVDGVVTAVRILNAGCCYTETPTIHIASPPMMPTVSIQVSKVKVTQNVTLGLNYVLESSSDLITWTATGPQFTANSETIVTEFDIDVTGRYFRIRQVP